MWKAAKAAYTRAYEDAMKKMRKENEEAFEYLWKTFPVRYWRWLGTICLMKLDTSPNLETNL